MHREARSGPRLAAVVICSVLAVGVGAVEPGAGCDIQGDVAMRVVGTSVFVAVDELRPDEATDGTADCYLLFESATELEEIEHRGFGFVRSGNGSATVRFPSERLAFDLSVSSPDAAAVTGWTVVRSHGGHGLVEGRPARSLSPADLIRELEITGRRAAVDVSPATGEPDRRDPVQVEPPDTCARGCSIACEGGGCDVWCNSSRGYCASCSCATGAPSCGCDLLVVDGG